MLAFAGGSLEVEWVRLNEVVTEMAELASAGFSAGCQLELELAAPGPGLEGDATQLRQVALNLMLNAAEALDGDGGRVRVATGEATIDRARLARALLGQELPEGRYAFLRVSDDGCGISDEVKARIFDPFFSTKFAGRGLGLAAVLGIVKAHRGAIEIDSAPGEGTNFAVLLPISSRRS
jgi:signal transduction histidine kinase